MTPRPRAENGNSAPTVSLRDYFDQALKHQTDILEMGRRSHAQEHDIHLAAHEREHLESKDAIRIATKALDEQLATLAAQFKTDFGVLTKEVHGMGSDRTSAKGWILGATAVLTVAVIAANFLAPLLLN